MAILLKQNLYRKPQIDLTGPDGNAFALMGHVRGIARQLGRNDDVPGIIDEMMSGDYDNLVAVFDREFGDVVDLIR